MNIQRYIKKLHTEVISGRWVQNLPQCNNDAAMFLQGDLDGSSLLKIVIKFGHYPRTIWTHFFPWNSLFDKKNARLGVNKINVYAFDGSAG